MKNGCKQMMFTPCFLPQKHFCHCYARYEADKIGRKRTQWRVACFLDAYCAEVYGEDVKSGFGRTHHYRCGV